MPSRGLTLYLASQSSRRKEFLKGMKIPFKVAKSTYRERWCRKTAPEILCVRHAIGKVRKAILPPTARFVLGGDTIVWHQGHGLGKPATRAEALRMLRRLAGRKHTVYTGLAIWDRKAGCVLTGCARTDVWMKPVGEVWLQKYVDTIHPFDKAGAYAIQAGPNIFHPAATKAGWGGTGYRGLKENKNQCCLQIVRKIRGSYSNVVGLPKELFRKMLKKIGQRSDAPLRPKTLHFGGRSMKRAMLILLFLVWGMTQGIGSSAATTSQRDTEPEDYALLREIIATEFSGQTPHEWGESVSGVKTRLKTEDKVLAIGMDICDLMGTGEDAKLIKFFAAENIPATLFVCGEWVDKNSSVLKKLAANPIFEIANQGISRKAGSVTGKNAAGAAGTRNIDELFAEIEKNARKIEAITGILPQYYHAGAGYYDEVAVRIVKALGYEALGSYPGKPQGPGLEKKQVLDALVNPAAGAITILGGVSLQSSFVESAVKAVRKLRSQGYKFVKVSDYPLE